MGSMGSVVGEKVAGSWSAPPTSVCPSWCSPRRAARACRRGSCRSCRWRRCRARWNAMRAAQLPYISVLTDPTTGGVTASFAMQGDVILAEPRRAHRLRGPARHQRHHQAGAARRLPDGRVRAGARADRRHRGALRDAQRAGSPARAAPPAHGCARRHCRPIHTRQLRRPAQIGPRHRTNTVTYGVLSPRAAGVRIRREGLAGAAAQLAGAAGSRSAHRRGRQSAEEVPRRRSARRVGCATPAVGGPQVRGGVGGPATQRAGRACRWRATCTVPRRAAYIDRIVEGFIELHGDRAFADDGAVLAGIGWISRASR